MPHRPEVEVCIQDLVVAKKLNAVFGNRRAVLALPAVAGGAASIGARVRATQHDLLVDVLDDLANLQEVVSDQALAFERLVAQRRMWQHEKR